MISKSSVILFFIFALFCGQGAMAQKRCSAGQFYSPKSGYSDLCDYCPAGTWSNGTVPLTACEACPAGLKSASGASSCSKCSAGTYEKDRTSCESCPYPFQ